MKRFLAVLLVALLFLSACGAEPELSVPGPEAERTSVNLAIFGGGYEELEAAAKKFNYSDTAPEYIIEVVDYCEGTESIEQAVMRLNSELGAGSGPDMIAFIDSQNEAMGAKGIIYLSYMARGWLEDMGPYLDRDEELTRDKLVNIKAIDEYDGIYILGNAFVVNTAIALEEKFGDRTGWTIQEYLEIESSLEPWQSMCYYMNDNYFMENIGGRYSKQAINWKDGTCDFNNSEFVSILEAAARVNEDNTEDFETMESFTTAWQRIGQGQLIISSSYISNPVSVKEDETLTNRQLTYIGWPTPDGSCGSDFNLLNTLGISSSGEHKDICWEFVKYFVMHPDSASDYTSRNLPLYRPALARVVNMYRGKDDSEGLKLTSREEVDEFYALLEVPEGLAVYDKTVMEIMLEEAERYFSGIQSAQEAATTIQDRVSIYVSEQS